MFRPTRSTLAPLLAAVTLAVGVVQAQATPTPMSLEQALALGPDASAEVLTAHNDLTAAKRDEARVLADPSSLRVDRIAAQNASRAAEAHLRASLAANRSDVASAYFDALEAESALQLADLGLDIQTQTLAAQQARRDAGAATDLDVAKAENDTQAARSKVLDAQTQRTLTMATLASLIGAQPDALESVTDSPTLDALDTYEQALQANAQRVSAANAVALAQARLDASNNDFTAQSAIDSARDTLASAQLSQQELERTLALTVRSAYARAQAAAATLANARASDATAAKDLATAKTRLDAGSIAPLTYRSGELSRQQAQQALESALHAYLSSIYALQQTVAGN